MPLSTTNDHETLDRLHRYFRDSVSVSAIAEPLVSFDAVRDAGEVRAYLQARDFDVVGVRVGGLTAGWARREDLVGEHCREATTLFGVEDVIEGHDPLDELITRLGDRDQLFVRGLGVVTGIVTRADLQKPPVRIWLFGLVTVLEEAFLRLLRRRYPNEDWKELISKRRLRLAERRQHERRRRNESLDLAACLQFSDKADILLRDEKIRERLGLSSRRQAREALRDVEQLRNQLAHAHDFVSSSLPVTVQIAGRLERILDLARA